MNGYLLLITLISCMLCIEEIDFGKIAQEIYSKHNAYREFHGSAAIELDENLNEIARKQAVNMADQMHYFILIVLIMGEL